MRRGSAGSPSTCCSISSASCSRRGRLVEPRLIRERGIAVGEVDQAALLAALRHDDPHAAAGALGQPGFERLALVRLRRHVHFGRRAAQFVELLDRRRERPSPRRRRAPRRSRPRCRARRARRPGPLLTWNTWTDDAGRTELQPEHVAVPELGGGHLLLAIVQRLDGPQRVAQLRRLLEPLARRGVEHPALAASSPARRSCPPRNSSVSADRARVLLRRADRLDARARCSA